jgi:hypothetical protein
MNAFRIRLSDLLLIVMAIAVDIGWTRYLIGSRRSLIGLEAPAFDMGVASMLTVLLFAYRVRKPDAFFKGFLVGTLLAVFSFCLVARYKPDLVRAYVNPIVWGMAPYLRANRHGDRIIFSTSSVIFLPPQLILGFAGGLLASRRKSDREATPPL